MQKGFPLARRTICPLLQCRNDMKKILRLPLGSFSTLFVG